MQELDEITVRKAADGDKRAFRKLYDHYSPFLWRVVFTMCGRDMTAAGDMLQDIFIRVYESLRQFRGDSALSTWLYRVAFTTVAAQSRKARNRYSFRTFDDTIRGNERSDTYDDRQLAQKILGSLSVEDRFLIVSRELHGIPFEELAEITGQKSGALRTRLHRLKESIRTSFHPEPIAANEVYHGT